MTEKIIIVGIVGMGVVRGGNCLDWSFPVGDIRVGVTRGVSFRGRSCSGRSGLLHPDLIFLYSTTSSGIMMKTIVDVTAWTVFFSSTTRKV